MTKKGNPPQKIESDNKLNVEFTYDILYSLEIVVLFEQSQAG